MLVSGRQKFSHNSARKVPLYCWARPSPCGQWIWPVGVLRIILRALKSWCLQWHDGAHVMCACSCSDGESSAVEWARDGRRVGPVWLPCSRHAFSSHYHLVDQVRTTTPRESSWLLCLSRRRQLCIEPFIPKYIPALTPKSCCLYSIQDDSNIWRRYFSHSADSWWTCWVYCWNKALSQQRYFTRTEMRHKLPVKYVYTRTHNC